MTIRSLDPSGELGKLFFHVQSKDVPGISTHAGHSSRSSPSGDAVDLSRAAKAIQAFTREAAAYPEVRNQKVQDVQRRLDTGQLLATSDQLAEALVRETFRNSLFV